MRNLKVALIKLRLNPVTTKLSLRKLGNSLILKQPSSNPRVKLRMTLPSLKQMPKDFKTNLMMLLIPLQN